MDSIFTELRESCCSYYFSNKCIDRNFDPVNLFKFMNKEWSRAKLKLKAKPKLDILVELPKYLGKVTSLVPQEEDIIAFSYPTEVRIGSARITHFLDFLSYKENTNTIRIGLVVKSLEHQVHRQIFPYLISYLEIVKTKLNLDREVKHIEYILSFPDLDINVSRSQIQYKEATQLFNSAVKGYMSGSRHPLPCKSNCYRCDSSSFCNWKSITNI